MSGLRKLFGGGNQNAISPDYTGLQIQTAVNALPVPLVWGMSKVSTNIVWYDNFQATAVQSGGGGGKGGLFSGGGGATTGYTYSADVILALCEGPISGINQIWRDQSTYTLADLGLSLFDGATPQSVWSYLESEYPAQALAYQGTAYVCAASYSLGSSATLSNHNFEIEGIFYGSGVNGLDADPALVVNDFLTNAQYGVGFPSASIDSATLFGSGGDSSYQTYCKAAGLCLSPALTDQEQASSILARWLQLTNTAAVWSGGQLKFIPYGDTATTAGAANTATISLVVPAAGSFSTTYPEIYVCPPATFLSDLGVKYSVSGAALTNTGTAPTGAGTYGISPNGTYLFSVGDENVGVTISYSYATAASFVPNITPLYDLDDDDYEVGSGKNANVSQDPLRVSRSDPYEAYNIWRLEIGLRANAYNLTPIESRDQNAIELYGERIASTVTAHEICDPNVALISGQLMVQRAINIRDTYKFALSWEYCLLDPMDIVTLTDGHVGGVVYNGVNKTPVRITAIEEDENGFLQVTAEEFPLGAATATLYPLQINGGTAINRSVAADPVNTPAIFEPPSALVGATPQIWIAASGGSGGVADPNWGGAYVWLSLDGTSYSQVGAVMAPARQGALTASLASFGGTNPDTADTLAVDLAESGGTLSSVSSADASLATTLSLVEGELLSYQNAALTSASNYSLTTLYRGLYGTTAAAHSSGAPFARLDGAVFQYDLPTQYIGVELRIKLQSFNVFGNGVQDLSTCADYTYTPTGPAAPASPTALAATGGSGSAALSCTNPNSANFSSVQFYRAAHGAAFGTAVPVGPQQFGAPNATSAYADTVTAGTYDYFAVALNSLDIASAPVGPATATVT